MAKFSEYLKNLNNGLKSLHQSKLNLLFEEINKRINSNNTIYFFGNGGSQANASHIVGDYLKSFAIEGLKLKISNLSDNVCFLTAASNDISFEDAYSILFKTIIEENDLIIYLSGSGNSMNLVKCASLGKKIKGLNQVSITAYNGGALNEIVDIPLHIKISDMEIAEDCQLIIFHYLKQILLEKNTNKRNFDLITKYKKRTMDDLIS